jgi:hypothetical protein
MTITLHETRAYNHEEIVAVAGTGEGCARCALVKLVDCTLYPCDSIVRKDLEDIIWLRVDDALKARLRGSIT